MPALSEISIYSADNTLPTGSSIQSAEHNTHRGNVRSLFQNELSYLADLERNFSSGTEPTDKDDGKIWYDSSNTLLKLRVNSTWKDMMSSGTNYNHGDADFTTTGQLNCHELTPHGFSYKGVKYKYTGISATAGNQSTTTVTGFFTTYGSSVGEVIVTAYKTSGDVQGLCRFAFTSSSSTYQISSAYACVTSESGGSPDGITPSVSGSDLVLTVDWTTSPSAISGGELCVHVIVYDTTVSAI